MTHSGFPILAQGLGDAGWAWGLGVLGGIGEFSRAPWESVQRIPGGMVTARGAIALRDDTQAILVAHEALSRRSGHWQQGLSLCLDARHADLGEAHEVVTELGPDDQALRPRDQDAILFDMGLGFAHMRACVRTADPALLAISSRAMLPTPSPRARQKASIRRSSPLASALRTMAAKDCAEGSKASTRSPRLAAKSV